MGVVTRSKKQNSGKTVSDIPVPLSPSTISRTSIDRLQKLPPSSASKTHFEKAAGQKGKSVRGKPPPYHVCGKQFRNTLYQEQHYKSHTKTTRIPCLEPGCNKFFERRRNLRLHQQGIHQRKWKVDCSECGKPFLSRRHLRDHMVVHINDRKNTCDVCKAPFLGIDRLQTHMRRKHERIQDFCAKCEINIRGRETIEEHMLRHETRPDLVCRHCDVLFSSKAAVRDHLRYINGETPFPCDECDRAFSSHSDVGQHKARYHGHKQYVCDVLHCGKAFADLCLLRSHKAKHHDGTGFVCPICGAEYFTPNALDIHIREHKGDTPYVCSFPRCSKKFVTPYRLHQHSRNHTQFRCDSCARYFDTAVARHQHKQTCPRYVCSNCRKRGPSDEYENHKAACNLSKNWKNGSKTMTVEDFQIGATTLQEYLEANKIEVSDQADRFRSLWESKSPNLFLIDTEFAGDLLLEICVMKADGEVIVDTIVNHQTQIQTCCDRVDYDMRSSITKVYGTDRDQYTPGMTMELIAEALVDGGFGPESVLAEWSSGRCDYWKIFNLLNHVGLEHLMPPKANSWQFLLDWSKVVKKSRSALDCRLSVLYLALQPGDTWLPRHAHRAGPDTLMLLRMTQLYFDYVTNLRQKTQARITDFFQGRGTSDSSTILEDLGEID